MVKTQKKQRKEGTNDFDSTSRDRDDVQSPAYSDISDDSTPVTEPEISGKFFASKLHSQSCPFHFYVKKLFSLESKRKTSTTTKYHTFSC